MARLLLPETAGMYRLNFDALDGDVSKVAYAEPVPLPLQTPLGNLKPWRGYGGQNVFTHPLATDSDL